MRIAFEAWQRHEHDYGSTNTGSLDGDRGFVTLCVALYGGAICESVR
jgi:hypothetical protein